MSGSQQAPITVFDSPDPAVLVPSSSPVKPPTHKTGSTFIPSSNLARGPPVGSPHSVITSISRGTANGNGTARAPINVADYSPSSPQPFSRLKPRYDTESPTKPGAFPVAGSSRKAPSLIAAAKATHDQAKEARISRFRNQFPKVPRHIIAQTLDRHTDDASLMEDLGELNRKAEVLSSQQSSQSSKLNLSPYAFQPKMPAGSSTSSLQSIPPTSPKVVKQVKRSKNEKSTIYRNREKGRKRDPDEDSNTDFTDEDSEGWSDEDSRKKKRRRASEDEVDAAAAALRGFNKDEASTLLGTIACSEEQAAKIIQLRPYANVDDVHSKLSKARGVSYKLFEQYEEIMEGYVQIDACLNRCEAIADDIATTLAVWKGAATVSDSVTGTPRSDGLNDVKVDVNKVSELLLLEKDTRKKKILSSYIRTQPSLLSSGTVLKDYQLLGVNWLNLLYSRNIGCILADEMGECGSPQS